MNILGIETSCDETSAAVVRDGREVLSNVIASQVEIHARFGGIVPEVASRQHMVQISTIVDQALEVAGVRWKDLGAIAVTHGPGLAGALLVGVNFAKAAAWALGIPVIGVNHLEAHIYANWLSPEGPPPQAPRFPLLCLIVSGGHTEMVLMTGHGAYEVLGRTRDDAAGEAFDKVARILGLGYPGGPVIQKVAEAAERPVPFPRAWLRGTDDFSFSGLKTAVLHAAQKEAESCSLSGESPNNRVADLAAGFQDSVVDVLVEKTVAAARRYKVSAVALAGGVAANIPLRTALTEKAPGPTLIPPLVLCTDNAAMIACCGRYRLEKHPVGELNLDVNPGLRIGS